MQTIPVNLFNRMGEYVTRVEIELLKNMPEGIMWGSRSFFRKLDGRYYEGTFVCVDLIEDKRRDS